MRILRSIVGPFVAQMGYVGKHLCHGLCVTAQLVGDDDSRRVSLALEQFAEELLGGLPVAARLHQNVQHFTVLVNGSPQVLLLAMNRQVDFVQMPAIPWPCRSCPQPLGVGRAKFLCPVAHRLVGKHHTSHYHHFFDIPVAQCETKVQPYAVVQWLMISAGKRWR